jgi:hypothetical protein
MSVTYGGDKITFDDGSSIASGYTLFRNRIINGAMDIDQRNNGASVTVSGQTYAADRFLCDRTNGYSNTGTAQQVSDAPVGFVKSLRYTAGTAETPTSAMYSTIAQYIEGNNIEDLGWGTANAKAITLSFWVKISITGTFGVVLRSANAGLSYAISFTYSSANTWQLVTATVPGPTTGTFNTDNTVGFSVNWDLGVGPTLSISATGAWQTANALGLTGGTKLNATTGATYQLTGVQLEVGSFATTFERRPYGMELQLCQRYYYRLAPVGSGLELIPGLNPGTTSNLVKVPMPVSMRTSPSISFSSAGWGFVRNRGSFTAYTTTGVSARDGSQPAFAYFDATVSSGLTSAEIAYTAINDGSWLAFSAEF